MLEGAPAGVFHRRCRVDRRDQCDGGMEAFRHDQLPHRIRPCAEGAVDFLAQMRAEAARQAVARQAAQVSSPRLTQAVGACRG